MCGIFGFSNFKNDEIERARLALHTMQHRGPDQWNEFVDEKVYLGHRRLSILDLSEKGKQPITNADGSIWITVNGEIYNFQTLRKELEINYVFNSKSDSEVLLHGYSAWGLQGLLERIDGMFAFALYDKRNGKLFIVRDRIGIKPLYYSLSNNRLMWASELKAIRTFAGEESLEIDYTALYDFFTYQYIPAPKSLYNDVHKLKPAEYIEFDIASGSHRQVQYWSLPVQERSISAKQAEQEVYFLLDKSVREQMMSDVPLGFFLSGGMDSSAVVALASLAKADVNTFTIGFDKDPDDESKYAAIVADYFKTKHHERILDGSTTASLFPKIKEWYDEPFGDISCFPSYLVSKVSKEQATVVLTGDGGDELFAGYKWYAAFALIKKYNLRWFSFARSLVNPFLYKKGKLGALSKKLEWLFLSDMELYTRLMGGLLMEEKSALRKAWAISDAYDDYWYFRKYYREDLPVVKRLQYLDFHTYLPDDILTKVDRVSMAVSLECRVPFLSRELVECAFTLPQSVVLPKGRLKGLLKDAFRHVLPSQIITRGKKGFSPPIQVWRSELYKQFKTRHYKIVEEVFKFSTTAKK